MKKTVLFMSGILFFVFAASAAASGIKVGYVDIEKVFNQYEGTKKAKDRLKAELDREQAALEKEKAAIIKESEDLEKKSTVMDRSELMKKQGELKTKAERLQMKTLEIQQKLLTKEKEMTAGLVDELRAIVVKIAKNNKYDYVFERNMLLFGGDDITGLVTKEMNK
ncbi:MAG TPA: OmpH family outer membrane protein [bacterium]|nr:OmpH family outer membrane protein [bacterium]